MTRFISPVALLETDERITHLEEDVGVPEALRQGAQRYLRHCVRITIEARGTNAKFAKINGIKLNRAKPTDEYPAEDLDDVLATCMCCINDKFAQRRAADDSLERLDFRVVFDQRKDGNRSRPAVELDNYSPDGPDMPLSFSGGSREDAARLDIIDQLGAVIDKLCLRLDEATGRTLEAAEGAQKLVEPLLKILENSETTLIKGMEMQRRAMDYMYSTKRIDAEEAGKDRRAEKWMEWLKKPANTAIKQLGRYMANKARNKKRDGDDDDDDDDDDDETDDETTDEKAPSAGKSSSSSSNAERSASSGEGAQPDAKPDAQTRQHPCATMARSLGQQLRPAQWAEAAQHLSKKQIGLFSKVLESQTDAQVIAAYDRFSEAVPMVKLMVLQSLLDKRQAKGLDWLRKSIEQARKGWPDESGKPTEPPPVDPPAQAQPAPESEEDPPSGIDDEQPEPEPERKPKAKRSAKRRRPAKPG